MIFDLKFTLLKKLRILNSTSQENGWRGRITVASQTQEACFVNRRHSGRLSPNHARAMISTEGKSVRVLITVLKFRRLTERRYQYPYRHEQSDLKPP
jgi:hypothetical protein